MIYPVVVVVCRPYMCVYRDPLIWCLIPQLDTRSRAAVFFRNNHFSALTKHDGQLFLLVTDLGYRKEAVVWERLDDVTGDVDFLTGMNRVIVCGRGGGRRGFMSWRTRNGVCTRHVLYIYVILSIGSDSQFPFLSPASSLRYLN